MIRLIEILERLEGLAPRVGVEEDPEEEGLYLIELSFEDSIIERLGEELEASFRDLRSAYWGGVRAERDEERPDAWIEVEGPRTELPTLLKTVDERRDQISRLTLDRESIRAIIYPKGSLSAFATEVARRAVERLGELVRSYTLIGYDIEGGEVKVLAFVSLTEECAPEWEHEHHHEH